MTTAIIAKDRQEARDVALHLRLYEWRYLMDARNAMSLSARSVVVLAPGAQQHEDYYKILEVARNKSCQLFEVDAWRDRFMTIALYTKSTPVNDEYRHEERELYLRDEAEAQALDGKDGWVLVWWGDGREDYERHRYDEGL